MKKALLIMFSITTIVLTGCTTQTTPSDEELISPITTLSYENKANKLKAEFPSNRTFKENVFGSTVIFFTPEKEGKTTKEHIGITIKLAYSGTNLESFYEENKNSIKALDPNMTIKNENETKIDNYPAKQIEIAYNQGEYKIQQKQTIFMKNESIYIVNYVTTQDTFDDYKDDAEKIVKSIRVR